MQRASYQSFYFAGAWLLFRWSVNLSLSTKWATCHIWFIYFKTVDIAMGRNPEPSFAVLFYCSKKLGEYFFGNFCRLFSNWPNIQHVVLLKTFCIDHSSKNLMITSIVNKNFDCNVLDFCNYLANTTSDRILV